MYTTSKYFWDSQAKYWYQAGYENFADATVLEYVSLSNSPMSNRTN